MVSHPTATDPVIESHHLSLGDVSDSKETLPAPLDCTGPHLAHGGLVRVPITIIFTTIIQQLFLHS